MKRKAKARLACVVAVAALAGIGCRRATGPAVVLITLDTTRADRIGAYGYADAKTPVLDALAARGTVFEQAYASAPITLPSHLSMQSGLDPNANGVHDNGRFVVPTNVRTVAEQFRERGYRTAAFVSAFVLDSAFGLDRGFEVYDDDTAKDAGPLELSVPRREGTETTKAALAWLAGRSGEPFFLWTHYYDVHVPRRPPPPHDAIEDRYDGSVAYVDAEVGKLLKGVEAAARGRELLVVVLADHGESLGDHDEGTHGAVAYDSTLRVPLIALGPGFPAGTRSKRFVRTIDVAATLAAAIDVPAPNEGESTALQKIVAAPNAKDNTVGYFETFLPSYNYGWARISGVRDSRWKYTAEPEPRELYDVLDDPEESRNRFTDEPAVATKMAELYERLAAQHEAPAPDADEGGESVRDKLAALGYVSAPQQFAEGEAPDPRKFVGAFTWVEAARLIALEGRVADSIEALEIFATSPQARGLALRSLSILYQMVDRTDEAIESARELARMTGGAEERIRAAMLLSEANRAEEALAELEPVFATDKKPTLAALSARANALLLLGRLEEAARDAQAILDRDPDADTGLAIAARTRIARDGVDSELAKLETVVRESRASRDLHQTRALLARLLHAKNRDAEAIEVLRATDQIRQANRTLLGEILVSRGQIAEAAKLYEEALARQPGTVRFQLRLADLYSRLARLDDAIALYGQMLALRPADATLYVDRGSLWLQKGARDEAETDFRKAIELDERLPEAAFNLGLILLAEQKSNEAERWLLRAVESRPDYAKAHFHLARIYRERNDPRARDHAERAAAASATVENRAVMPGTAAHVAKRPEDTKPGAQP